MGLSPRPTAIEDLQAASAVGQGKLYRVYDELLRERADATYKLLQAPGTSFLVVATPEPEAPR